MDTPARVPDAGAHLLDTGGFGMAQYCGVFVLQGDEGVALVEAGPSTTVERVLGGLKALRIEPDRVTDILATHIHLDHAGATGHLLEACPNAVVHIHEKGVPFVTEPEKVGKLLASVERAVGERFPMYGTLEPLPAERVVPVRGGERIEAAGRTLELVDAPGHAPHQYVVHDPAHGTLYAGDAAGIRTPSGPLLMTTPPPRFDLAAWRDTLDRLESLNARWLLLTHFGWVEARTHLPAFREALEAWVDEVKRHKDAGATLEETIRSMSMEHTEARAVYDEAAFEEEMVMNTTGVWLYLERGA